MSDIGKFSSEPQRGHAWRGDWQQRIKELLARRSCSTVTEFFDRFPTRSSVELADELGPGDVAGVQLEWLAIDEATATNQVERLARDQFVRALHKTLPEGWVSPATGRRQLAAVLGAWTSSIASRLRDYGPGLMAMGKVMIEENPFPEGWLPSSPDDPLLVAFFETHWTQP